MYESFFKFNVSPFQLSPNSLFYYDSNTHRRALMELRRAKQSKSDVCIVTGEPGTGKTELMRKFIKEFDKQATAIANIPLTSLRSHNILDSIASSFGVVNMGFVGDALWSKTAFLGKIQQELSTRFSEGKRFVIFVDNAESLSKSCLNKLMQLCSVKMQGEPLVQCFLFGETTVAAKFLLGETRSIQKVNYAQLDAFNETDTRRYIEHRLIEAGWQGEPEITDRAYEMIHRISEGIPWHVNLLCHRILLQCFLEDTQKIDERIVNIFEKEKHVELHSVDQIGVAGSDVAEITSGTTRDTAGDTNTASNVVSINQFNMGRDAKGTSFSSYESEVSLRDFEEQSDYKDSLSPFFRESGDYVSSLDEAVETESPISIEAVKDAFESSVIGQDDDKETTSIFAEAETSDTFFPNEYTDADKNDSVSNKKASINVSSAVNIKTTRDGLLDKILPKAGYYSHDDKCAKDEDISVDLLDDNAASISSSPALENQKRVHQDKVRHAINGANDEDEIFACDSNIPQKSSTQIAARASIVTSLAITMIMWVIGDTRTVGNESVNANNQLASRVTTPIQERKINSITPSPFENASDAPRARLILKK